MVCDTRSRSKMGSDDDNDTSKNRVADGEGTSPGTKKTDCLGLRRVAQVTSSKHTSTSPSPTRKSERIQKKTSPITPTKSGKVDKLDTPSPLRRSDRGKSNVSLLSKVPENESNSSHIKIHDHKEETMEQLMMESEDANTSSKVHYKSLSSIGKKRKRVNSQRYTFFLKRRRRKGTPSGIITKSKRPLKFPVADSSDFGNEESKLAEDKENAEVECHIKVGEKFSVHLAACVAEGNSKDVLETFPVMETLKIPNLVYSASANSEINSESVDHGIIRTSKTHLSTEFEVEMADANMHKCIHRPASTPLTGHENQLFAGSCVSCSKQLWAAHDSPKVELCSCVAISNNDASNLASPKDGLGVKAICISGSAEKDHIRIYGRAFSDSHVDMDENVCPACLQGGKSLLCNGNGCKGCYHLPYSGSPISDIPSGVWHCPCCLKKMIEFGVHSVTKGVDSICDVREVDASGTHRQKQYLVKYIGLAHVHNNWVSEARLLFEAPLLVANFSDNNQVIRWNSEWTVPHRLLKKRLLSFSELQGDCQNLDTRGNSECQYEWLIKWRGLDYENATWELEYADCLCSPHGKRLIREYEMRQEKAKQVTGKNSKQSLVKFTEFSDGNSLISDMNILNSVNKLHDHWCKSQNVAFYDDQEQIMKIVLFILSMSTVCCCPVLIVTASHAISQWETELKKWAPSVDCVVYQGNRDTRMIIEALEFYSEGGSMMLQVLLTSLETAVEDIQTINRLSWEVVVIDQCQQSNVFAHVEKIETLGGLKVLLFNGPIKHTASEYLNILSLVDSDGDLDKVDLLETCSNDTLGELNEKVVSSEFVEYWLPAQISELQLELYCDTLLSNIDALCSYPKSDPVGALNDMLLNVRKCCDHPYIIFDPSMSPFNKELSQTEILNIGIQASGKLQLLDKMLYEMKCRQLRTIVLFQSYVGTTPSIGNILEDFLRQRFGENSYELVDAYLTRSKKDSALNRFNSVENGRFVLLLENRACKPSFKPSSVDNIIIYGSDTNPLNDMKLLERISLYSKAKQIKVFRLYSCFTVEEQALSITKKEPDPFSHSLNRNVNDTLRWGASDLFCRLDENYANESDLSSGQLLLSGVVEEFCTIISESSEKVGLHNSLISKVLHSSSHFSTNFPLFGEQRVQCTGEEPCVFWKSLLGVRNPQWKHLRWRGPRSRKRAQFFGASTQTPQMSHNEVVKKCRKTNSEGSQVSTSEEGPSIVSPSNESSPASTTYENSPLTPKHFSSSLCGLSPDNPAEVIILSDTQSSLHILLKEEMAKVFEVLKLPEDVERMAAQFLEYVMENHRISRERVMSVKIFQAFQISMCWMAASLLKQKVDKDEMLALTKEHLKFKCTKDEALAVYLKFRALKKLFLHNMKRNEQTWILFKDYETNKKGETCRTLAQPLPEEHITDEVLLAEREKDFLVSSDNPTEVPEDAIDVDVGLEHDAEANTTNVHGLTNIEGNQKDVASNYVDENHASDKVNPPNNGGLLPPNQSDRALLSENRSTLDSEAGITGPTSFTQHEMPSSKATLAKNCEHPPAPNDSSLPSHDEAAYLACDREDNALHPSRPPSPLLVETGTGTQPSIDSDSRDPLHNEFDRIRREMENAAKSQEDLRSQIKSDCDTEIKETITEIRNKYNSRLHESEMKYSLIKNELGGNLKKVLLNKLLADTFRSKCLDLKPSRIPGMQAIPTSFMQHLHQVSMQIQPTLLSASLTGWQKEAPLIASPYTGEQNLAAPITRLPSPSLPSAGQLATSQLALSRPSVVGESARRPPPTSVSLTPAIQQSPSMARSRSPSIPSSPGEQTSAPAISELPSLSLSSRRQDLATAQETSGSPMPSAVGGSPRRPPSQPPSYISFLPASQQNQSTVQIRSPSVASSAAGEQTSSPALMNLQSLPLSSGRHYLATAPSKSSAVGEFPRKPSPSIASSMPFPVVGESPRKAPPPPFSLSQSSSQQLPSTIWSRSPPSTSLASQQTIPVSLRSSLVSKSPWISHRAPVIGSITPSSGNLRTGGDIRAPAPHLQSFRPSLRPSVAAANFPPSNPSSLDHSPLQPSAKPSLKSQPNNRTSSLPCANNVPAMELLRNLDDFLGKLSVTQKNQIGKQVSSSASNLSSSSFSLKHGPSRPSVFEFSNMSRDKEEDQPQPSAATNNFKCVSNQIAPNDFPFSALELLRNVDSQACPSNQTTKSGLPSLSETNLIGTVGSSSAQGSSTSAAPLSTDVGCLSNNNED
ncbi:unnamed protein product [Cuscuta europaea]|uniref:Uncharacterized protein n=1 Tax=Cuscuta europaea TaxID=41803 RepID=A0A9P1EBF6_CUSEU|nr:unnamed protein product [Cuscuta europaea]